MLHAIDVSHHQQPRALDWAGMREAGCDLCIVRLTYGTRMDERAREHIARARDNGFAIGAYAFARTVEPVLDQFHAFWAAAEAADYGRPEDVIPALDMEDDTSKRPIHAGHAAFFQEYARLFQASESRGAYAYVTARDFGRLGQPQFILEMPLFVAHYAAPSRAEPATPNGMPWAIWQHRVAPFLLDGPSGYDTKASPAELIDQGRVRRLVFFNGEDMTFADAGDEALRLPPDTEATDDIRLARHAAWVRAYASERAAESADALREADRNRAFRAEMDTLDNAADSDPEGNNIT